MKIVAPEAPTGASQAEPTPDFYGCEIAAGRMMGVVIRCGESNETRREIPVSLELGVRISHLVLDYVVEQQRLCEEKLAHLESRTALSVQEGGLVQ